MSNHSPAYYILSSITKFRASEQALNAPSIFTAKWTGTVLRRRMLEGHKIYVDGPSVRAMHTQGNEGEIFPVQVHCVCGGWFIEGFLFSSSMRSVVVVVAVDVFVALFLHVCARGTKFRVLKNWSFLLMTLKTRTPVHMHTHKHTWR